MVNIAVLGTNFGKYHTSLFRGIKDVEVVTVFGRNEEKLAEIETELGIQTTKRFEDILENDSIDLVDICLPSELHAEYAIKCLNAKKHVLSETPVTLSSSEALRIQETATKNQRFVFVDQFIKFSQPHKYAIDFVQNVKKKSPTVFTCYNKTASVWGDLSIDKSLFYFFIHNIDFLFEIMGSPSNVFAHGLNQDKKSSIFSEFEYQDEIASITCLSNLPENSPFQIGYELIFDDCILTYMGSYGEEEIESIRLITGGKAEEITLTPKNDYEEVFKHVIDCLNRNEKSTLLDIEIAMKSIQLVEQTQTAIGRNAATD